MGASGAHDAKRETSVGPPKGGGRLPAIGEIVLHQPLERPCPLKPPLRSQRDFLVEVAVGVDPQPQRAGATDDRGQGR